jgi:hypothetical protein
MDQKATNKYWNWNSNNYRHYNISGDILSKCFGGTISNRRIYYWNDKHNAILAFSLSSNNHIFNADNKKKSKTLITRPNPRLNRTGQGVKCRKFHAISDFRLKCGVGGKYGRPVSRQPLGNIRDFPR